MSEVSLEAIRREISELREDMSDLKNQMDVEIRNLHDLMAAETDAGTEEKKKKKKKGKKKDKKSKDKPGKESPEIRTVKGKGYPHRLA